MKKQNPLLKALFMLLTVALFSSGSLFAQNTTITDLSTHSADASAVLDVYANPAAATRLGMLIPRLSDTQIPNHTTLATGLLYFNTTSNVFKYYDGANWKIMSITDDIYWARNFGQLSPKVKTDFVGIGDFSSSAGITTWLTVIDKSGLQYPQFHILGGGSGGDASMRYSLWGGEKDYCHGILDNSTGVGDNNFKICNDASLSADGYGQPRTMMEIHDEDWSEYSIAGIIDFNHQSRARVYQGNSAQLIQSGIWWPIDFDNTDYDEHSEFTLGSGGNPSAPTAYFTATETGYYQVNSRTEFDLVGVDGNNWVAEDAYVSIAIYKGVGSNWNMYAQGNNLQIGQNGVWYTNEEVLYPSNKYNNAPNVSDVVYLQAGEKIAIYVWQNAAKSPYFFVLDLDLIPGTAKTYVSIHKVS